MHFVGPVADLLAGLNFLHDVCVSGCCNECREPVQSRDDPVLDLPRRNVTWPPDDTGHAEATFQCGPFATSERSLTAIGPGEVLSAVIGGEDDDRVVIKTIVFQVSHDGANDVVELCHSGLFSG